MMGVEILFQCFKQCLIQTSSFSTAISQSSFATTSSAMITGHSAKPAAMPQELQVLQFKYHHAVKTLQVCVEIWFLSLDRIHSLARSARTSIAGSHWAVSLCGSISDQTITLGDFGVNRNRADSIFLLIDFVHLWVIFTKN